MPFICVAFCWCAFRECPFLKMRMFLHYLYTPWVGGRSQLKAVVTAFFASFTHICSHMRVIALGVTAFSFLVFFQSCFRREKFEWPSTWNPGAGGGAFRPKDGGWDCSSDSSHLMRIWVRKDLHFGLPSAFHHITGDLPGQRFWDTSNWSPWWVTVHRKPPGQLEHAQQAYSILAHH